MNKKLFKLPIFTTIGGIVFYIINFVIVFFGFWESFTDMQAQILSYIPIGLVVIIILVIGIILRKTYSRRDFFKAGSLLVAYTIIISLIQRIVLYFDLYNFPIDFILSLPIAIFTLIESFFQQYTSSVVINSMLSVISFLGPYIFILFGKSSRRIN